MHGLINRSVQNFVCDSFGPEIWAQIVQRADIGCSEFEAMLSYDDDITPRLVSSMAAITRRTPPELLEDLGTYLVSTPKLEGVRRLLRFGGVNFEEFLHSLDDLPDRAKLAVSDLDLPPMELIEHENGRFELLCQSPVPGFGYVMAGVLRVIADDYGALVLLDHDFTDPGTERVFITLIDTDFAEGRHFDLGARVQ